jgi:hypothetical protein
MLLWIEGFEGFGTTIGSAPSPTNVVSRKYSGVSNESDMDIEVGRLGGYCIEFPYTGRTQYLSPAALTINSILVVGVAVRFTTLGNSSFLRFYDGATLGMNVRLTINGELAVYRGTTLIATTSGLGIQIATWYYVEFKVLCHASAGSYELRVGEETVLSATGVNTQVGSNAYHTTFQLAQYTVDAPTQFDDTYCLDGSGSVNNDFLGNMRVNAIYPNADTVAKAWTRSAGSDNYVLVDEVVCDDDTTYVESETTDQKDLYEYSPLSGVVSAIKGIQINTICRETDAESFDLVTVVKSGSTESDNSPQAIGSTNYVVKRRIVELDPDTGLAWTVSGVNAVQAGIKMG